MNYKEQKQIYLQRHCTESRAEQKARDEGYEAGYEQSTHNWCNRER